ncbi:pyroglutamyl-peptidase I [Pectobacterium odoriferum]|uniref:Pyrrolidone-carboxylate peptidase n=1 Tax=Pectobacterium odoriferum TaxID=78398 RepID=A0ABD6VSD5_9GAMM|nr:pyroglutamyl-peptidase I [Pectobacterium odoriferum]MBA0188134.1 pyroglutamyl-peptidase I [Pectobacterium odoriferum]POD92887.1 pyroglutamyl-peptidase I [Pectobacterium odoriferum]POD97550.1 pyroglutamyl-peptidase I [Pectobacterium odoriferum]POE03227.1 pyroglutamyl-peptidase I [Pectobacterium odoriferum]POE14276.1 pyroglutamyl-peptidase I [Pectobacterium odoriferum]
MKTVLITAFEPFEGEAINPSWEAVKVLHQREVGGARVVACRLSCVFDLSLEQLYRAIAEWQPEVVIAVGQAGGRTDISVERVAININDARIADNRGNQPIDTPVVEGGPAAYFSTLPVKALVQTLRVAGIPASVSHTAGTFVCNHVMYGLLHQLHQQGDVVRGGFVHIPYSPEQAARHPSEPSMPTPLVTAALEVMIKQSLVQQVDVAVTGGSLH